MRLSLFFHSKSHYFSYFTRLFLPACFIFIVYVLFLHSNQKNIQLDPLLLKLQALQSKESKECRVPQLDPWDKSILSYYSKPADLVCKPVQEQLATFENGILKFDASKIKGLKCRKVSVSHNDGVNDADAKFGDTVDFDTKDGQTEFAVEDEFFEVFCEESGIMKKNVYKYHFAQIIPKNTTSDGTKKYQVENSSVDRPPVIIIGFDSMSRGNFVRQMPKTYEHMKMSGFVDMKSHVKVGDNTYQNLCPVLMGKRGTTITEFDAEIDESWGIAYDQFDFVWKNFSKNGYATLFAEDRPDIGTFNYLGYLNGFLQQPTDHYFRTYWLAAYFSMNARRSTAFCYDSKPNHVIQLEYLEQFIQKYEKKRHFAFWWTQDMSHDYLNHIGKADNDVKEFFERNEKYLEDSIVIVMSDHGHRYDQIRETTIGRLEARLPFLSIRIPKAMQSKHRDLVGTLRTNSQRLTGQFDLNESLNRIAWNKFGKKNGQVTGKSRALSIFHEIPKNRSCLEAEIPQEYCPCYTETPIPLEEAKQPAEVLLRELNELLSAADVEEYDSEGKVISNTASFKCAPLQIANITFATVRLPPKQVVNDRHNPLPLTQMSLRYRIVIVAKPPSNAVIEGVVVHDLGTKSWSTTGEFERNNKYGDTSHCVADRTLKKICHCIQKSS